MDVDDVWACLVKPTHPTRKRRLTEFQQTRLRRYLADRDVPCPRCEYNLRGLKSDTCPECGEPLSYTKVKRGLPRPNDASMDATELSLEVIRGIASLISLELVFAFILMLIAFFLRKGVSTIAVWGFGAAVAVALFARIASTRFLLQIERRPHQFSELPRSAKWTIAVTAVVVALAVLVAVTIAWIS